MTSPAEKNVQLIERLVAAMNEDVSAAIIPHIEDFVAPEVVWHGRAESAQAPGGAVEYSGYEGLRRFWTDVADVWAVLEAEVVRVEPLGDDVVLVLFSISGTGRASGARITQDIGTVYVFRDGLIVAGENFTSHAEAEAKARELATEGASAQA